MHLRNNDQPYLSTSDAMSYWVEVETAIGVTTGTTGEVKLISPFPLKHLLEGYITMNPKRRKPDAFHARIRDKAWLERWPYLKVKT
jgi:hypothetical protein